MDTFHNTLGQLVGCPLPNWTPPPFPPHESMLGSACRLEPLSPEHHASDLYDEYSSDAEGGMWTYLPVGPFGTRAAFNEWISSVCAQEDPQFYAIIDLSTLRAVGAASLMRIVPLHGCIEVGYLAFSPALPEDNCGN